MNILVLTSQYPGPDLPKGLTPVVHYFAKEWVKYGHNVSVIYNLTTFPKPVYWILRLLKKRFENKAGFSFVLKELPEIDYEIDGVKVFRRNIRKQYPGTNFKDSDYLKHLDILKALINESGNKPDIIVGHWWTPQLRLVCDLGKVYNCKTAMVAHGLNPDLRVEYKKCWKDYIDALDLVGYRSLRLKKECVLRYEIRKEREFMCYSGIPDTFVGKYSKMFDNSIRNILYVGTLIGRKYPDTIIKAVHDSQLKEYSINYIGTGPMKDSLNKIAQSYSMGSNVHLLGRLERDKVGEMMHASDCFIMISRGETFGLVYLEAMAHGCITIAAKDEGIDGIIVNGENGFLCEAGNATELTQILDHILTMSQEELQKISVAAQKTACSLTDKQVAKVYLDALEKCVFD